MNIKFLGLCLALILITPVTTFAASDPIFDNFNGSGGSASGVGTVNLNSYGVSSLTIQVDANAYAGSQIGGNAGYYGNSESTIHSFSDIWDIPSGSDPLSIWTSMTGSFVKDGLGNWTVSGTNIGTNIPVPSSINIQASAIADGNDAVGTAYAGGNVYYTPATTGTINVTSNNSAASWTITNPATLPDTLTGTGMNQSYPNQTTAGIYTITWNPIAGYVTPEQSTLTIGSGQSRYFEIGFYYPNAMCRTGDIVQCGDWGGNPICMTGGVDVVNNSGLPNPGIHNLYGCICNSGEYVPFDVLTIPVCSATPSINLNFVQ